MTGIIVINYKNEELTTNFILNELGKIQTPHVIVVVNNGASYVSNLTLVEKLNAVLILKAGKQDIPKSNIYIINSELNLGFAKGNNLGVEFLYNNYPVDYLLFTNTDIIIKSDNVLDVLIEKIRNNKRIGIIGPNVVGLDGKRQSPEPYTSFRNYINCYMLGSLMNSNNSDLRYSDSASEGFHYKVMGSFFMCTLDDYINCGKMDPNTFLYFEENILTERMQAIGKNTYFDPSCTVVHNHGTTISKYNSKIRQRNINYRSASYYYQTYCHVSPINVFLGRILLTVINLLSYIKNNIH